MTVCEFLENKNIVVLGFGKQGKSTFNYIRKHFPNKKLTIADKNINIDKNILDDNVALQLGENYLDNIDKFDLIIKSPGVVLKDENVDKFESKIITDYELLLRFTPGIKIGITGTKGKSTTSTILYNVLKEQGKKVFLLGNIGNPIFNSIDDITTDSYCVIEVSSHTLEFSKYSPDISILLNIYPEHLDHVNVLEDYVKAKFNIAINKKNDAIFIYNAVNELMAKYNYEYKENDIAIFFENEDTFNNINAMIKEEFYVNAENEVIKKKELYDNEENSIIEQKELYDNKENSIIEQKELYNNDLNKIFDKNVIENNKKICIKNKVYLKDNGIYFNNEFLMNADEPRKIKGNHMLNNMMFILAASQILGLDLKKTVQTIKNTEPLEHRMEYVGKFDGIYFYDDAIATIPIATINCIKTLEEVDTLICGGMDREVSQMELINFLKTSKVRNIICMPDTGNIIYEYLKDLKQCYKVNSVEETVVIAKKVTKKEKICVLSPAASSYNQFKSFEEKGNLYKKCISNIM